MNIFKFRLQTPYNVISWREKLAKQEVKERQMAYDHEMQFLNEKLDEMTHLNNRERGLQGQSVLIEKLIILKELQEMSIVGIKFQQEVVEQALFRLEESHQRLTEVSKEKKSMEKLKERRYRRFLEECLRQEQIVIDEVAVTSFWRTHSRSETDEAHQGVIRSERH